MEAGKHPTGRTSPFCWFFCWIYFQTKPRRQPVPPVPPCPPPPVSRHLPSQPVSDVLLMKLSVKNKRPSNADVWPPVNLTGVNRGSTFERKVQLIRCGGWSDSALPNFFIDLVQQVSSQLPQASWAFFRWFDRFSFSRGYCLFKGDGSRRDRAFLNLLTWPRMVCPLAPH